MTKFEFATLMERCRGDDDIYDFYNHIGDLLCQVMDDIEQQDREKRERVYH